MSEPEELDASLMASLVIAQIAAWNAIERALSASRVPLSYGRYLVLLTITGALGRAGRAVFEVLRGGLQAGDAHGEQGGDQEGFQNSCSSANGVKPWISFLSIRPERLPMLPSPFRTNSR